MSKEMTTPTILNEMGEDQPMKGSTHTSTMFEASNINMGISDLIADAEVEIEPPIVAEYMGNLLPALKSRLQQFDDDKLFCRRIDGRNKIVMYAIQIDSMFVLLGFQETIPENMSDRALSKSSTWFNAARDFITATANGKTDFHGQCIHHMVIYPQGYSKVVDVVKQILQARSACMRTPINIMHFAYSPNGNMMRDRYRIDVEYCPDGVALSNGLFLPPCMRTSLVDTINKDQPTTVVSVASKINWEYSQTPILRSNGPQMNGMPGSAYASQFYPYVTMMHVETNIPSEEMTVLALALTRIAMIDRNGWVLEYTNDQVIQKLIEDESLSKSQIKDLTRLREVCRVSFPTPALAMDLVMGSVSMPGYDAIKQIDPETGKSKLLTAAAKFFNDPGFLDLPTAYDTVGSDPMGSPISSLVYLGVDANGMDTRRFDMTTVLKQSPKHIGDIVQFFVQTEYPQLAREKFDALTGWLVKKHMPIEMECTRIVLAPAFTARLHTAFCAGIENSMVFDLKLEEQANFTFHAPTPVQGIMGQSTFHNNMGGGGYRPFYS